MLLLLYRASKAIEEVRRYIAESCRHFTPWSKQWGRARRRSFRPAWAWRIYWASHGSMEPIVVLVVVPPCWKATCHHFSPLGCNKLIIRTGILDACVRTRERSAAGRVCRSQWQTGSAAPLTARARSARSTAHARPLSMHAGTGRQAGAQGIWT